MNHRQLRTHLQGILFAKRPGPTAKIATYCPPSRAKFFLIPIGILITTLQAYCQISDEKPYLGNARYIETSAGTGLGRLSDFATSPLYYEGVVHRYAVSLSRMATKRDVSTGFSMVKGNLKSDFNEHTAESALTTFSLHHSRLYQILRSSPEQWNFKIGGEANVLGNLRVNRALMNSAVGIEAFPSLFGSFKVTRDISRQTGRRGKEPKKKSLSLRVNASLIGTSFRNGYSYLGIGQVIDKSGIEGVLDDYRFKAFGVNALSSSLDYTIWLKNKNGWRISYAWEAYKTRNDYADFEMASHTIRVAILFNTKNN